MAEDGRCPECGEDEMDGGRCYYCGFHDYNCELPDCERCTPLPTPCEGRPQDRSDEHG